MTLQRSGLRCDIEHPEFAVMLLSCENYWMSWCGSWQTPRSRNACEVRIASGEPALTLDVRLCRGCGRGRRAWCTCRT